MRQPKFLGVYSLRLGPGEDNSSPVLPGQRKAKALFFIWELPDGFYAAQPLGEGKRGLIAAGNAFRLGAASFKGEYRLESSFLLSPTQTPDFNNLAEEWPTARQSPSKACELNPDTLRLVEHARRERQVENELRNNFRKALRGLSRPRERKGALAALAQIAASSDGIVPAHKHAFRDFGVEMRKQSLPELALLYSQRVLDLAPKDDHAHFNLARILCMLEAWDEASAHLKLAMSMDANEPLYPRLLAHIERQRLEHGARPSLLAKDLESLA